MAPSRAIHRFGDVRPLFFFYFLFLSICFCFGFCERRFRGHHQRRRLDFSPFFYLIRAEFVPGFTGFSFCLILGTVSSFS